MNTAVETKRKVARTPKEPARDLVAELLAQVTALTTELAEVKANLASAPSSKEKKETKKGQPREHVYYVVLAVPTKNFPPQALTCMKVLSRAADPTHISEADAMRLLEENKSLLGTRQDSWRIFCYYRAKLIAANYLKML